MSKKMILIVCALSLFGAGCSPAKEQAAQQQSTPTPLAASRLAIETSAIKPGPVTLKITVFGTDGKPFSADDLEVRHEKKFHFLMVRDDMTGFQHLHPEYIADKWVVTTTIPEQGVYHMYADVDPRKEEAVVLRLPLVIGGETTRKTPPAPSKDFSAQSGDYQVKLLFEDDLMAREDKRLTFEIKKNGQPAVAQPYLGAFGHVVLLRHDHPDDFIHVHPMKNLQPTDGRVVFETNIPATGRYTFYAQFRLDAVVHTFPITADVLKEGRNPGSLPSHGHQ